MYLGGEVYNLMYDLRHPGVKGRMNPGDVWSVDWNDLTNVARIQFDDETHKATVIRLEFGFGMNLQRYGSSTFQRWVTRELFLTLSTRNATMRRLLPGLKKKWNERIRRSSAFLMGTHARLGDHSLVRGLDAELVRFVYAFV